MKGQIIVITEDNVTVLVDRVRRVLPRSFFPENIQLEELVEVDSEHDVTLITTKK